MKGQEPGGSMLQVGGFDSSLVHLYLQSDDGEDDAKAAGGFEFTANQERQDNLAVDNEHMYSLASGPHDTSPIHVAQPHVYSLASDSRTVTVPNTRINPAHIYNLASDEADIMQHKSVFTAPEPDPEGFSGYETPANIVYDEDEEDTGFGDSVEEEAQSRPQVSGAAIDGVFEARFDKDADEDDEVAFRVRGGTCVA